MDLNVVTLIGSLRSDSFNRRLFERAKELAPEGIFLVEAPIADLPLYDDDARTGSDEAGFPETVQRLRTQLRSADAILFISPEYNYSIPGVLKNAIDWASRPPEQPFEGKPVGIMGASSGRLGTARMQYHLRQVCVFLDARPLNRPEVMVAKAKGELGADARLQPFTEKLVVQMLENLAAEVRVTAG